MRLLTQLHVDMLLRHSSNTKLSFMTDLMSLIDSWGLGAVKKIIKVTLFLFLFLPFESI